MKQSISQGWKFIETVAQSYVTKNGREKSWEYARRSTTPPWISDAAATLLEDIENKCFILVEEYRIPIARRELGLVAWISDENIPTIETIAKEVREEAGRMVIESKFLETIASSAWITNEQTDIYHSTCNWKQLWQILWEDEEIKIHEVKIEEIDDYLIYVAQDLWLRVGAKIGTALRYIRAWKGIITNK